MFLFRFFFFNPELEFLDKVKKQVTCKKIILFSYSVFHNYLIYDLCILYFPF